MRVLLTGSSDRASRLAAVLGGGGHDVVAAAGPSQVEELATGGSLAGVEAVIVLPEEFAPFETKTATEQLFEFLEEGLLARLRSVIHVCHALDKKGNCRFVLVGGNVPPTAIPDDQSARAGLLEAVAKAAVLDGGPGCSAKVLGPTATDDDIVTALKSTGRTPMVVWDLPTGERHWTLAGWRDALMAEEPTG
jgi:hypothetical protein